SGTSIDPVPGERSALVIGAGLAGAAITERLAARGWEVHLVDRHARPAAETSGLPVAAFHPHVSRDDSILSRLTRAGLLYAKRLWTAVGAEHHDCGALQLPRRPDEPARMA